MVLTRTYAAGREDKKETAMGEFEFAVDRNFIGETTLVGDCVATTGSIHVLDELWGDKEVGFFNMIDTTDARLREEEEEKSA
jgi:hypothetical protein